MMQALMDLRDMLCAEIDKIAQKGELSAGSLETVHKLTDTVKNIDKITMLEEEGGASETGYSGARYSRGNSYRGNSYNGNSSDGGMNGGYSGARRGMHYVRGHYSRANGYSRDDGMAEIRQQLGEMMQDGSLDRRQQTAIREALEALNI